MHYTQLFRTLREHKGLSHEALAKLAHCHRNTIVNAEGGRRVKLKTLANLMGKMGYASNSPEMASLTLLWAEAVSGIDLADPAALGFAQKKLASYNRTANQAGQHLLDAVRRNRLNERQIRLLIFVAQRSELLEIIESIQDLLQTTAGDSAALKAAEDK
jgi:DNA-binding XRE family transcriptional regulator